MNSASPIAWRRIILAFLPVLLAFGVQLLVWPFMKPLAWVLFYPAVFFSTSIGGRWPGVASTCLATLLVWYFFLSAEHRFDMHEARTVVSSLVFLATGITFSLFHDRLREARLTSVQSLTAAGMAREEADVLRQSGERYRLLLEQAPDGLFVTDSRVQRFLEVNSALCRMLNYRREDLLGLEVSGVLSREDRIGEETSAQPLTSSDPLTCRWRVRCKDGSFFTGEVNARRLSDGRIQGLLRNISERRRSELALQASEAQFRSLFENMQEGFFLAELVFDGAGKPVDWRFLDVNPGYERIMGLKRKAVIGKTVRELFPWLSDFWFDEHARTALTGEPAIVEGFVWDNNRYYVNSLYSPRRGQFACLFADATARKRAEAELREKEERLTLAMEASHMGVWTWELQTDIVEWSAECYRIHGVTEFAGTGNAVGALLYPEDAERVSKAMQEALQQRKRFEDEFRIVRPNGDVRWVSVLGQASYSSGGETLRMIGTILDITPRKLAELELTKYAAIVESSNEAIISRSMEGRIESWNQAAEELFGYSREEMIGKDISVLVPSGLESEFQQMLDCIRRGERVKAVETVRRRKDGSLVAIAVTVSPIKDAMGRTVGASSISHDITERKRAANEIKNSQERLHAILNTVSDAIITIDRKGSIRGINLATTRIFGYAEADLLGKNISSLLALPHQRQGEDFIERYYHARASIITSSTDEVQARRKDGTVLPVELAVGHMKHRDIFTVVMRDITERKRMERDLLKISESEQRRIGMDLHDGLGQQITSISIINNVLTQNLQQKQLPEADTASRIGDLLGDARVQMRRITRGLNPVSSDPKGLMAALQSFLDNSGHQFGDVEVKFECPEQVLIDDETVATHLFRITQEAVQNSLRHASPKLVCVKLRQEQGRVLLDISDDGSGKESEGFRRRSGLGLRTMRYRAEAMNGFFDIDHPPEGGTVIHCSIPDAHKPPVEPDQPSKSAEFELTTSPL